MARPGFVAYLFVVQCTTAVLCRCFYIRFVLPLIKGNARGRTPASKETVLCRRVRRAAFVPAFFGRMKTGNRLLWERDNIGKDPGFFGERTEYGFPVLVRIMRHRSASPAKSQAFPQLGKAEPARFLGGKITAGNFLPKTRRA